jgi:flagellar biosynthesis/type III secretory pathway chaperone
MLESTKKLIEALRDELKNYGEMLALLDRQQEYLMSRAANEVSQSISRVQAQGVAIQEARKWREDCRRAAAKAAGKAKNTTFKDLIPLLPADYQPLLQALVDENNELLLRVRRRARQNHLMLKRLVELMQQLLNSLCPPGQTSIRHGQGGLPAPSRATRQMQEEVTD